MDEEDEFRYLPPIYRARHKLALKLDNETVRLIEEFIREVIADENDDGTQDE